ncbi:alpha-tubulin N-acetyltransferase 1-like [Battus philenor]|uniref:alpha-tubulin N-acetyltransferase 1-like n=1 Tax=Battus philenor TaxID=42288 RepID=UPI0035D0FA74
MCTIPVNDMLKDPITKIDCNFRPPSFTGSAYEMRMMQETLAYIIDELGEQSAKAQNVNKPITTAEKIRNAPSHFVYLLKDAKLKGGKGDVIGLLKMGRKHLYLFQEEGRVCEVEPICVLDFYICESQRRKGYGKKLFDYMLMDLNMTPEKLAIDGPSETMQKFLATKYDLHGLLRQSNNFAVTQDFFKHCDTFSVSSRKSPISSPSVGRFAAMKPPSLAASVIHGDTSPGARNNLAVPTGRTPDNLSPRNTPHASQRASPHVSPLPSPGVSPRPSPPPSPTPELMFDVQQNKQIERPSTLPIQPLARSVSPISSPKTGRFAASQPPSIASSVIRGDTSPAARNKLVVPIIRTPDYLSPWSYVSPRASLYDGSPRSSPGVHWQPSPPPSPTPEIMFDVQQNKQIEHQSNVLAQPLAAATKNAGAGATTDNEYERKKYTSKGYVDLKFYHNKLW